jgi:hypothetical protein
VTGDEGDPKKKREMMTAAGWVAVILAIGMAVALNVITIALLYAAIVRLGIDSTTGLSDNGVQVLLAWGGGIVSVLAGYVGYAIGKTIATPHHDEKKKPEPSPPDKS